MQVFDPNPAVDWEQGGGGSLHPLIDDEMVSHSQEVLSALLEISNYVGSDLALDEILQKIVVVTARTIGLQCSSIYLWNEERTKLLMRANVGFDPALVGKASFAAGKGIPGWVAEHGEIVALADGTKDPRYDPLPTTLDRNFKAYLCAPLWMQNEIIGVLTVRRDVVRAFSREEITIFETICKQVAIVIEKSRMHASQIEAEKLAAVALSLSGIAHYMKNVLLAMRGGEYMVDVGIKRGDLKNASEGWGVLKRSIAKISSLVENIMNYNRDRKLHPRPVELNNLILKALQDLEDRAMERNTVLTPDLDLRVGEVEIDPDAFDDILLNLISNGIDAIDEGAKGVVRVQSRLLEDEGQVKVVISDNGVGIEPEHRAKLFHLFFSTKGKGGTGIGLAATRKLILDHKGTIDFTTELGVGTDLIIHLPLRQSQI